MELQNFNKIIFRLQGAFEVLAVIPARIPYIALLKLWRASVGAPDAVLGACNGPSTESFRSCHISRNRRNADGYPAKTVGATGLFRRVPAVPRAFGATVFGLYAIAPGIPARTSFP